MGTFTFLLTAVAQAALPERGSRLLVNPMSQCHPWGLCQLWAYLAWARERTGMIKLLLVLLLLFLSLFMVPQLILSQFVIDEIISKAAEKLSEILLEFFEA